MITIKTQYISEDRQVIQKLVDTVNATVNNFCVQHKQTYVIFNDVTIISVPITLQGAPL